MASDRPVQSVSVSQASFKSAFFLFWVLVFLSAFLFARADEGSGKSLFLDSDQDGLTNDEEALYGTDPAKRDTDGDGYSDGVEVESGYDPKKPAPGDRIAPVIATTPAASEAPTSERNLTLEASEQIASIVKGTKAGDSVSLEEVNAAVQEILAEESSEVTLPEIDREKIKIKKAPDEDLSDDERKEQEKEDIIEYLTVMGYLFANYAPDTFQTEDELGKLILSISSQSTVALTSGNRAYLDALAERGKKLTDEALAIEVPETMIETHVQALRMAAYAQVLKDEVQPEANDPLSQIAALSRVQGFLGVVADFSQEVHAKMEEYGIAEIPIEF